MKFSIDDITETSIQDGEVRVNLGNATTGSGVVSEAGVWCTANVISVPEAPSNDGACQAVYVQEGHQVRVIGYRDNRNASKAGNLVGGDFAVVNSGNARILLKREKEAITLYTENASGDSIMVSISGTDDGILITHGGGSFVELKADGATIAGGGCSLEMRGGVVSIVADYIALNAAKGNLGVVGAIAPQAPAQSVIFGTSGAAGAPSANWTVAP